MEYFVTFIAVVLLMAPLFASYRRVKTGKKGKALLISNIVSFFAFCVIAVSVGIGQSAMASEIASPSAVNGLGLIAAALATGLSGIGGGIAVSAAASAALGAISENDKMFGKALIFVALAEGVALYGLIISFQILGKL